MKFKRMFCVAVGIGVFTSSIAPFAAATVFAAETPSSRTFEDIRGRPHQVLNPPENQLSVVVFITTDCPIANSYQPTLSRLAKQFREQGVSFYLVHPSKRVSKEAALSHAEDFAIEVPVILDSEQFIAHRLAAKVTPEAFVIDHEGGIVYRGRIDDLYVGFGKKRRQPTQHDLRDAITAALAGNPPESNKTDAIGCIITYAAKPRLQKSTSP